MKSHYEILKAMKTGFSDDFRTAIYARSISSKEYERFISGQPPLILSDSVGKPLVSWSITGNTVQDGEPSPDNPVEVKGTGDKTENLFTDKTIYHLTISETGILYYSATSSCVIIKVESNCKYYISTNTILPVLRIGCSHTMPQESSALSNYIRLTNTNSAEITTGSDTEYLVFQGSQSLEITWLNELYVGQGYKIDVVTRGKNLVIVDDGTITSNGITFTKENGNISVVGTAINSGGRLSYAVNWGFVLNPGVYTFSTNVSIPNLSVHMTDKNTNVSLLDLTFNKQSRQITVLEPTTVLIGFNVLSGTTYDEKNINVMLELGSTATEYEPYISPITTPIYLNSPLMADETLDSTGKREVEWKELVLTKDSDILMEQKPPAGYIFEVRLGSYKSDAMNWYSDKLKKVNIYPWTDQPTTEFSTFISPSYLYFNVGSDMDSVDKVKEFLSNNPVTVWYQLAEPTSETVDVPQIPTFAGNCVIDVDTEVKPSEMSVTYKSRKGGAE